MELKYKAIIYSAVPNIAPALKIGAMRVTMLPTQDNPPVQTCTHRLYWQIHDYPTYRVIIHIIRYVLEKNLRNLRCSQASPPDKKVKLLMQAPPTDPRTMPAPDESISTLRPITTDVKES